MSDTEYEKRQKKEARRKARAQKKAQELTDLAFECQSFPEGHQLCVILDVINPDRTWMLIESLVDQENSKLVAGCRVSHIRVVPKPRRLPKGHYIDYYIGVHGDSERVWAMNEALKAVGSEPNVKIDW